MLILAHRRLPAVNTEITKLTHDLDRAAAEAEQLEAKLAPARAQRNALILALVDAGVSHRAIAPHARVAYPYVAQLVAKRRQDAR